MEETTKKSYYAIIPANVRYDNDLSANAKLLYGEITALCNERGFCWATNNYFAELYSVSTRSITNWVSELENKGYVFTKIIKDKTTKQIIGRNISIINNNLLDASEENSEKPIENNFDTYGKNFRKGIEKNFHTPIEKNFQYNNTSINNTFNNSIGDKKQKRFCPPTLEEVKAYCIERKNNVDPARFFNYYTSNGWHVGKNKMKDWKAAVRTWERNYLTSSQTTTGKNGVAISEENTTKESADFWAQVRKDSGANEGN